MEDDSKWVLVSGPMPGPGEKKVARVAGHKILLANVEGEILAIDETCTHAGVSLEPGRILGHEIECPVHGARFDMRTGNVLCPPARRPLKRFPVRPAENGAVEVRVEL